MIDTDKPDLDNDLLLHYGVAGMKWGRRRGSKVTGVSRARGALIDRNDRYIKRANDSMKGKGLRRDRISYAIDKKLVGKKTADAYRKMNITHLKDQNSRLKSGKTTVIDKLTVVMTTTPLDFVMSNRPK